jgi:YVTN family beta-propeller protein
LATGASAASPTITVGTSPQGVAVNPSTNTVYVANFYGNTLSVIAGSTNTVAATVSVGRHP